MTQHTGCYYEQPLRNNDMMKVLVPHLIEKLKPYEDKFDGVAVSGYSMALLGPIIAYHMGKHVCVIAKCSDKRTTPDRCEGLHNKRWIVIDDLVHSGKTLKRVMDGVKMLDGSFEGLVTWAEEAESDTRTINTYNRTGIEETFTVPHWVGIDWYKIFNMPHR